MFKSRWFRRGLVMMMVPLTALACHGRGHRHANMSEEQLKKRVEHATGHVLDYVDASEDQSTQINQLLDDAVPDLLALRTENRALAKEYREALGAETVDKERLEQLRGKSLDLIDRASARILVMLTDAADVLNQEQRAKLLKHWRQRTES